MLSKQQDKVINDLADTVREVLKHQQYCSVPISGHLFLALLADREELQQELADYKVGTQSLRESVTEIRDERDRAEALLKWRDMATDPPKPEDSPIEIMELLGDDCILSEAFYHCRKWNDSAQIFHCASHWRPLGPLPKGEQR